MLRLAAFIASAALVAAIALYGHWETDRPVSQPTTQAVVTQQHQATQGGVPWLPATVAVIVVFGAVLLYVALRRRRDIQPALIADGRDVIERWHCILKAGSVVIRRGHVVFPAADHTVVEQEVVSRYLRQYGADLPPDIRLRAWATPSTEAL